MQDIEEIYQSYQNDVYRYLLSISRSDDVAEELTQETFYQAIGSIDRFRGDCSIKTWLFQIAKHLWYRELGKKKRPIQGELTEEVSDDNDPASTYFAQEKKLELYRRIYCLKEPMQQVVLLRLSGDLSFREIGDIMNKTENWARITFYRAKQLLWKGWEQDEMEL